MLLPVTAEDEAGVVLFSTPRDAKRAIARTERVAGSLKGSLVDSWVRLAPLTSGQPYKIIPATRSHAGKPLAKESPVIGPNDGGEPRSPEQPTKP